MRGRFYVHIHSTPILSQCLNDRNKPAQGSLENRQSKIFKYEPSNPIEK